MRHPKIITCFLLQLVAWHLQAQETKKLYRSNKAEVHFFSATPLENIEANSGKISAVIDPSNRNVAFVIFNNSFQFENSLMQEHFNEKYMESEKYPKSTFSGTINEPVDLLTPGVYKVTVTGNLTIHGVPQKRTISGDMVVTPSRILKLTTAFDVKLVDHKIEVPQLVFNKIAETINVKVYCEYDLR